MDLMTKEESYAERRQLFKNIWETAMKIGDKDDIMAKPKVIKTLRLDEVDRCVIGKKKKERIRNLRTVCKKILDFCDRQDANDMFYEQIAEGQEPPKQKIDLSLKPKKIKTHRGRKKVKKAKSLFVAPKTGGDQAKPTTSERKDEYPKRLGLRISRNTSLVKMKKTIFVRRTLVRHKSLKAKSNTDNLDPTKVPGKGSGTQRKIIRKKRSKRKKTSATRNVSPPRHSVIFDWPDP